MKVALALVGIVLGLVVILQARPSVDVLSDGHKKSYVQFFNLEELIKKISLKNFREFLKSGGKTGNSIPSIDLTQEAIVNDTENPEDNIASVEYEAQAVSEAQEETETEEQQVEITTTEAAEIETINTALNVQRDITNENDDASITEKKETTNEIPGSSDNFFISKESINAARKYGYKILLKKIGGKVVPVGKIKFEFPTLVEINPIEDVAEEVVAEQIADTKVAADVQETTEAIENISAVTATEVAETITEAISTTSQYILIDTTTEEVITTSTIQTPTSDPQSNEPKSITTPSTRYLPPAEYYLAPEEAETAVAVLKDLDAGAEVSLPNCALSVDEVEKMLVIFSNSVESALPIIQEILDAGSSLATADTEGRARIGAELLTLLESVLEVIVPFQIPGCSQDSSSSILISMSSMASQLDTLASAVPSQRKSKSLHDKATSLQLSSWVMVQLKHAVKLFYSQDGICRTDYSSTSTILHTLSKAVAGYVPVATIIGNEQSAKDLLSTAAAFEQAAEEIAKLEEAGYDNIPQVSCDATFAEMGQAVSDMADVIP